MLEGEKLRGLSCVCRLVTPKDLLNLVIPPLQPPPAVRLPQQDWAGDVFMRLELQSPRGGVNYK